MNLKIKNCNECPFLIKESDFESPRDDLYLTCNLLLYKNEDYKTCNLGTILEESTEEEIKEKYTPSPMCPLRLEDLNLKLSLE